ncbi:uncharacterized protein VTP21DRAFT_11276 [Calcarisporiella thermophila]|uniref:uncharacterized protein n=1 Tax=Calcarisporiella thermophila TaxID=911321 RepID=UPI00374276E3
MGIPEPWTWACSTQVWHVLCLLNSQDDAVQQTARREIRTLVRKRYLDNIDGMGDEDLIPKYFNGQLRLREPYRRYIDCMDPMAHAPKALATVKLPIKYIRSSNTFDIELPLDENEENRYNTTGWRRTKTMVARIKRACEARFPKLWTEQPIQGRAVALLQNPWSNVWIKNDDLSTRTWQFAAKARTDTLPTNFNLHRWTRGEKPKTCSYCGVTEGIHHILTHCPLNRQLKIDRHNKIARRLARAARYNFPMAQVLENQAPPGLPEVQQRPDIIIIDENRKSVTIIDVAVCGQMDADFLSKKRNEKVEKYAHIRTHYEQLGYTVNLDAAVFGDLGGTDDANMSIFMELLGTRDSYANRMHRYIVNDILRIGHRMWAARCSRMATGHGPRPENPDHQHSSQQQSSQPPQPSNVQTDTAESPSAPLEPPSEQ